MDKLNKIGVSNNSRLITAIVRALDDSELAQLKGLNYRNCDAETREKFYEKIVELIENNSEHLLRQIRFEMVALYNVDDLELIKKLSRVLAGDGGAMRQRFETAVSMNPALGPWYPQIWIGDVCITGGDSFAEHNAWEAEHRLVWHVAELIETWAEQTTERYLEGDETFGHYVNVEVNR